MPLALLFLVLFRRRPSLQVVSVASVALLQVALFAFFTYFPVRDPAFQKRDHVETFQQLGWNHEVSRMSPYAKLNMILRYQQRREQYEHLKNAGDDVHATLWGLDQKNEQERIKSLKNVLEHAKEGSDSYKSTQGS